MNLSEITPCIFSLWTIETWIDLVTYRSISDQDRHLLRQGLVANSLIDITDRPPIYWKLISTLRIYINVLRHRPIENSCLFYKELILFPMTKHRYISCVLWLDPPLIDNKASYWALSLGFLRQKYANMATEYRRDFDVTSLSCQMHG